MPWMQAVLERANTQFNSEYVGKAQPGQFAPGQDLIAAGQALGIIQSQQEAEHVALWPPAVMAALQAAIDSAVARSQGEEKVPVQFTWTPGAGFGVSIWEAQGRGGSNTTITVQLQSPMPSAS